MSDKSAKNGRPKKCRKIEFLPDYSILSPNKHCENFIVIDLDEFEAIRLSDYEKMTHEESAKIMEISRPVFTKLLDKAHYKIAKALIEGISIKIHVDGKLNEQSCLKNIDSPIIDNCKIDSSDKNICIFCRRCKTN